MMISPCVLSKYSFGKYNQWNRDWQIGLALLPAEKGNKKTSREEA
jgi:hypothetical protein